MTREVRKWDEKMKLAEGEGPIQGRLNHYGGMTYCALGKYGEAGKGMMKFLSQVAYARADKVWKRFGCKKPEEAAPLCMIPIVRKVSCASVTFRAYQVREAFETYCRRGVKDGTAQSRRRMVWAERREEKRRNTEHEQWMEWGARGGDDYEGKGTWGTRPDARWESNKGY